MLSSACDYNDSDIIKFRYLIKGSVKILEQLRAHGIPGIFMKLMLHLFWAV